VLKTIRKVSPSEIRRDVSKLLACSHLKGTKFVAGSKPSTSLIIRKINFVLKFRYFNTWRCISILFDAAFPRHSKSPRHLVHFDNENEYITFFRGILLRTHAASCPRQLNPQLHRYENLETFTYAVGALVEPSLTRDDAQAVRLSCMHFLCWLHLSHCEFSEAV